MKEIYLKKAMAISKVFGEGQKIIGLLLEFNEIISAESVDEKTFIVEERKIKAAYTADDKAAEEIERGFPCDIKSGRYIIIELKDDKNAFTLYRLSEESERPGQLVDIRSMQINAIQKRPMLTEDGNPVFIQEIIRIDEIIQPEIERFLNFEYSQKENPEKCIGYNLYIPEDYDSQKKYPMVVFIEDAGVLSENTKTALCQGLGGVIWSEPKEQEKHQSFVLAPQYHGPYSMVDDDFNCTWEVEATMELIKFIMSEYSIDAGRIYGTGQSMGCMALCELNIRYPEIFAACLLVGGQWSPERMVKVKKHKFWIVVSSGDQKAFPGMNSVVGCLEEAGAAVERRGIDAKRPLDELNAEVKQMAETGKNIYYTWFTGDSVILPGTEVSPQAHHKNTWRVAYGIEALRDWLFAQQKN